MGVIDDYLEDLGDSQRAELERICRIVLDRVPDAEEGRSYGMPAFRYKRKPLLGFAALKDHLSLFPFSPHVVAAVKGRLAGYDLSKGTIRFTEASRSPRTSSGRFSTCAGKKSANPTWPGSGGSQGSGVLVMRGCSRGDAEGGQGPGGVAGVVAQRGGEVDRPCPAEHTDDKVAQTGQDLQASPGTGRARAGDPRPGRGPQALWSSSRRQILWLRCSIEMARTVM